MADVLYTQQVNSGFYDSVNQDRLYGADDMNKPYHRLVSNGVFAQQDGDPSDDLHVVAGSGLAVTVKAGAAILGDKWFELPADLAVNLEQNVSTLNRMDSIIARIDTNTASRAGAIVYRTGTPASGENPPPPALSTDTGVFEFRLANIFVADGASSISDANIYDMRGSDECPWVTSLVQQVKTSVLFNQWQTAYLQYFASMTAQFNSYAAIQQQAWEDFFAQAQSDLTATNNIVRLNKSIYTQLDVATYNIGISSFNGNTDLLFVFMNGLCLPSYKYSIAQSGGNWQITLTNTVPSGNLLSFVVLKEVVAAGLASTVSLIQELDEKVSDFMDDTGWIPLSWQNGASAYDANNATAIRKVGDRVYMRGAMKGASTTGTVYTMISAGYYPTQKQYLTAPIISGSTVKGSCVFEIDTSGNVKLLSTSAAIGSGDMVPLDFCYLV